MKPVLLISVVLGVAATVTASFNNTRDIYCNPQAQGTCTLTLHLGASIDKLQNYWNRLATLNGTEALGNSTSANKTRHGHHGHPYGIGTKTNLTLSGSYAEILKFLTSEGTSLGQKRDVIRHDHKKHRYANSSNFLGDVAMIHDNQCNPLSHIPTTNLTDNTVIPSSLNSSLKFQLYQPGSAHGHLGSNFVFEYNNQTYQDLIAMDAGLARGTDHPCVCHSASRRCPDGSERCCSCRFAC